MSTFKSYIDNKFSDSIKSIKYPNKKPTKRSQFLDSPSTRDFLGFSGLAMCGVKVVYMPECIQKWFLRL